MHRSRAIKLWSCVLCAVLWALDTPALEPATNDVEMRGAKYTARLRNGTLVDLRDAAGHVLVRPGATDRGLGLHCEGAEYWSNSAAGPTAVSPAGGSEIQCTGFAGKEGAAVAAQGSVMLRADNEAGEFVAQPRATVTGNVPGVWGVSWWFGEVPLEYAVIVPGRSGVKLTTATPGKRHEFDYPMGWEAQLVVIEGQGHGFAVWAEDSKGRYKRLIVERGATGWWIGLVTINDAPFASLRQCEGVPWRVGVYEGDWRVPARRYREWSSRLFGPVQIQSQQPDWIGDMRACVIMDLDREILEDLPKRLAPAQTMLYLYHWRAPGYDRDYPDYESVRPELEPFVTRAHALGFRVMLHVNYFGVDPKHSSYAQFEKYQVRDPFGSHEKQWWTWERADPIIKFAYINPALAAWRTLFTDAMVRLVKRTKTDALHLDQTLCIYNDHNGRIDGLSMLEGNIALHRQLRDALPDVALSGEGLNEVTGRYEAFAQRHAWGLNHADGTWDNRWLAAAHPISSYLLRPYTVIYGYLGLSEPETDQLYAAWNDAYEHWGVIPSLKPTIRSLRSPERFARQFFDEVKFTQEERLDPDLEAVWPTDVAMPYRTHRGERVVRTADGRLMLGDRVISRTVHGVDRLNAPGTIEGWLAYDDKSLLGLDPTRRYPYFDDPRDPKRFHVVGLAAGLGVSTVSLGNEIGLVRLSRARDVVADLSTLLDRATCGTYVAGRILADQPGPMAADNGAMFEENGTGLSAHPPYRGVEVQGGEAFARYRIDLPPEPGLHFSAEVSLDSGAVGPGRSDGATFRVTAEASARKLSAEKHTASAEKTALELDLSPMAGTSVELELRVGPGPNRSASFDWARWTAPRVVSRNSGVGTIAVAGERNWSLALDERGERPLALKGQAHETTAQFPGAVFFLTRRPSPAAPPRDLTQAPREVVFLGESGEALVSPIYAGVRNGAGVVGGHSRIGLLAHPPNRGRTLALFPMTLDAPARFRAMVGITDGSRSQGVLVAVEKNGRELASKRLLPGSWESLEADIPASADTPVVLSLVTDSDGGFDFDSVVWGEPRLEPAPDR